jgi:hypothetical protein
MLRKRKKPKGKSIAMTLMRDVQGSASMKLAMFQRVRSGQCAEQGTDRKADRPPID